MIIPLSLKGVLVLGIAPTLGCFAGWQRTPLPSDTVLSARQQVQVWEGQQTFVLHAVRLTADSLYGVPFQQPPQCDTCVLSMSRAQIDSLRLGNQEAPALVTIALPFAGLIFLYYLVRHELGAS